LDAYIKKLMQVNQLKMNVNKANFAWLIFDSGEELKAGQTT